MIFNLKEICPLSTPYSLKKREYLSCKLCLHSELSDRTADCFYAGYSTTLIIHGPGQTFYWLSGTLKQTRRKATLPQGALCPSNNCYHKYKNL